MRQRSPAILRGVAASRVASDAPSHGVGRVTDQNAGKNNIVFSRNRREREMREATYEDAVSIGRLLNVHRDEVWKILKGLRYSSESELSLAVHNAFKMNTTPDLVIKDPDRKGTAAGPSSRNDS